MKQCFLSLVLFTLILVLTGCGSKTDVGIPESPSAGPVFTTANGPVQFQFPPGWFRNPEKHPYDLQCFSQDRRMTTGVFLFLKADLAEDLTAAELFKRQIADLRSKRKNFKVIEEQTTVEVEQKKLTSVVYSGDRNASRFYYRFTLIEFTNDPGKILIALQVALPSNWEASKPVLEKITQSARVSANN